MTLCPVWVLSRSYQRLERVLIPTRYLLQERTYLRHQTSCSVFLVKTSYSAMLQADQQSLDLVQVKAYDIWAFVTSKAFHSGEQRMFIAVKTCL